MKKKILLFTSIAGIAIITLTSGQNGAGIETGYNCTGAETGDGNAAGCSSTGNSCHSTVATAQITVNLELDSAGSPITHYKPGTTYTVKITGKNTTSAALPKFGFQVTCIKGSSAVMTPDSAGKLAETGLPANVRYTAPRSADFVCPLIEHSNPIAATTLSGATGGTYVESFQWTAPAMGTGTVSFWGVLNAVNGNGSADASDKWNTTHIAITEADTVAHVGVANIVNSINFRAFPNPASNNLNLQINNAETGSYSLQVFDMSGRNVSNGTIVVNSNNQTFGINTSQWLPGTYQVVVEKDGNRQLIPVIKL